MAFFDQNRTIVFLGDSITEKEDGYVRLVTDTLQALYPQHQLFAINAGIGGDRSIDMLARLERHVLSYQPDIVTVSVGINDVWRSIDRPGEGLDIPLPVYVSTVSQILEKLLSANVHPVVFTTTIIDEDINSIGNQRLQPYNDALRSLATTYNLPIAEVNREFLRILSSPNHPQLTIDGVHLTHFGNVVMALAVLRALGITIG